MKDSSHALLFSLFLVVTFAEDVRVFTVSLDDPNVASPIHASFSWPPNLKERLLGFSVCQESPTPSSNLRMDTRRDTPSTWNSLAVLSPPWSNQESVFLRTSDKGIVLLKHVGWFERDPRLVVGEIALSSHVCQVGSSLCQGNTSLVGFFGWYLCEPTPDGAMDVVLVFEYFPSGTLEEALKAGLHTHGWPQLTRAFDSHDCAMHRSQEIAAVEIAVQLLRGLVLLHTSRHVLHHDIKPSNIFLDTRREGLGRVVLGDYGGGCSWEEVETSGAVLQARLQLFPELIGDTQILQALRCFNKTLLTWSPGYVPPEAQDRRTTDTYGTSTAMENEGQWWQYDIYSMGIVLVELLMGFVEDHGLKNALSNMSKYKGFLDHLQAEIGSGENVWSTDEKLRTRDDHRQFWVSLLRRMIGKRHTRLPAEILLGVTQTYKTLLERERAFSSQDSRQEIHQLTQKILAM